MPKFSAFTPFGILAFSGAPSELQLQYQALSQQLDQAFDPSIPSNEAEKYATARHLARINLTLQRAGNQRDVTKAVDLLSLRERDFMAIPGPYDSTLTRQNRLKAAKLMALGANASNIRNTLATALGSAFVGLRLVKASERATDLPTSNFQPLNLESKFLQLTLPLAVTGVQWATYENLDTTIATPALLNVNDQVTVQGENNVVAEVVQVTAVQTTTTGANQFQANFTNGHDIASTVTTMPFPRWSSTQSFMYVELTPAAAVNPVIRAQVDAIMAKLVRGWTQWAQVAASGGFIGPFAIGTTPLGTATFGTIAQ
jgi:hypothetical protein